MAKVWQEEVCVSRLGWLCFVWLYRCEMLSFSHDYHMFSSVSFVRFWFLKNLEHWCRLYYLDFTHIDVCETINENFFFYILLSLQFYLDYKKKTIAKYGNIFLYDFM
jgi:hypothetical protein